MTDIHNVPSGPIIDRYVDVERLRVKINGEVYGNIVKVTFTTTEIEVLLADGSWIKSTDFQFATSTVA
jgi:hypothetical protein